MNDFVQRMIASRKGLFWDKGPLDLEKDKFVIVERILEFGTERGSPKQLFPTTAMNSSGRWSATAGALAPKRLIILPGY